jgi:hypothetical protein
VQENETLTKEKNDPIDHLLRQTKATLAAVGVSAEELSGIFAVERGFALPFAGIQVSLKLFNGDRVWESTIRYSTMAVDGETESMITNILFREPMNQPQVLARKLAIHVATTRVDLAIEACS